MDPAAFAAAYGPWAVVVGAAGGMGASYTRGLARRGLSIVLVDVDAAGAHELAADVGRDHAVETKVVAGSAGDDAVLDEVVATASSLDVGLIVANAAVGTVGPFRRQSYETSMRQIDVNLKAPLRLLHDLVPQLAARPRSGVILMSSLSAQRGAPIVATYAASKAYLRELAESLWAELRGDGIDVMAVLPGSTRTPAWLGSHPQASLGTSGVMDPDEVIEEVLDGFGDVGPILIPGQANRDSEAFLASLDRIEQIELMHRVMTEMYPDERAPDPTI